MALKETWTDLEDAVDGVPDSGSDITVEPINAIAHAVIDNEKAITDNKNKIAELEKNSGGQVDLSNYYTKNETIMFIDNQGFATQIYVDNEIRIINDTIGSTLGDIESLLGGI